jgi:hypothetical protein
MGMYYEKQKKHAAAWLLKSLYTNDLWFDERVKRKDAVRNYLYVPLFDIADTSRKYDLNTLKDTCYLLKQNSHLNIWGDDYDPRAMLVQISDEGIRAYRKSFYGGNVSAIIRKSLTAIAALAAVIAVLVSISRFVSVLKHDNYRLHAENKAPLQRPVL